MPIYVYKDNSQISTNAIRNNKAVKAIYAKEQGKEIVCVWGDDFADSLFTYTITNNKVTINGFRANYQHNGHLEIPNKIQNKTVTSINYLAFDGCIGLTSLTIPSSVTDIKDNAFRSCSNLTKIMGSSSVAPIVAKQCNSTSFEVIITSGTKIKELDFSNCTGLTNIIIPNSVTNIGKGAFHGCSSLKSITIPFAGESVYASTTIGRWYGFGYIFGTSSYTGGYHVDQHIGYNDNVIYYIPSSLTTVVFNGTNILPGAFENCYNLTNITISDNLTSIGSDAFYRCEGLTSITFNGTKAQWNAISKGTDWNYATGNYTIHCTDGDIPKQ